MKTPIIEVECPGRVTEFEFIGEPHMRAYVRQKPRVEVYAQTSKKTPNTMRCEAWIKAKVEVFVTENNMLAHYDEWLESVRIGDWKSPWLNCKKTSPL